MDAEELFGNLIVVYVAVVGAICFGLMFSYCFL